MKIEKKHIIIAIVVAVVAYFLWKRYKNSQADDTAEKTVPVTSDVNAILKAIGASDSQKDKIREIVRKINASTDWKRSLEEKAEEEGLTYEQEAVVAAIWTVYMVKGEDGEYHGRADIEGASTIAYNLIRKVKNL